MIADHWHCENEFGPTIYVQCLNQPPNLLHLLGKQSSPIVKTGFHYSNGITVGIISIVVRALMTLWKSKIGVISRVISALGQSRRNQKVSIFFRLRLWLSNWRSSENQIVGFGSRSVRINQSQCMFPCFVMDVYKTWTSSSWTPTPVDHL